MDKESNISMEGIVEPKYNKRRKGYTFSVDGMEIFVKGEDKNEAMGKLAELLSNPSPAGMPDESADETVLAFSEGGATLMEEGGLKEEGGSVDPVSGNDVPPGSTKEEVRDDIPAQLSEGEFVFPADVVRYIGLENLMEIRQKAKMGLQRMDAMGQMGNSEEATMDDNGEYEDDVDKTIEALEPAGGPVLAIGIGPAPEEMAQGGMPQRKVMSVEQEMSMRQKNPMQMAQGGAVPTVEQQMMRGMPTVGSYVAPPNPMMGMQQPQPTTNVYQQPQPQAQQMPTAYNEGGSVAGGNNAQNTNYSAMGNYSPANTNRFFTPPSPTGSQTGLFRPEAAASLVPQYSQRQYYNPETGEIRVVNFISGRPAPPGIPPGFVPYDPSKVVEEETKKAETTQQNQEDSSDDRERNEQEQKDYAKSLTELNVLSEFSPTFKEFAEKNLPGQVKAAKAMQIDPVTGMPSFPDIGFMESLKDAFGPDFKTALKEGVTGLFGENQAEKAYAEIATNLGFSLNDYTTKGFLGFDQFNKDKMIEDLQEWSNLDEDSRDERNEVANRYDTNPISEQTKMLAEQDRGLFDDDEDPEDPEDTGPTVGDAGLADGSAGVTGDPAGRSMGPSYSGPAEADQAGGYEENENDGGAGIDSGTPFSKGGAVKTKRKKGLGRLK